jgi:arabinose-5-phosphate isomerase
MSSSITIAKKVIETEIQGLNYMSSRLGPQFDYAVHAILETEGRTIICGMGKSGIIGKKITASFASTGTPSFFMHPAEAFHGDLGMVKPEDVFIAISNSGETEELLKLLPFLKDNNNFLIGITGNKESTLAKNADCHLDIAVPKEACLLQLAPTSSTTATLVMGDALTVALMEKRNFQPENFARFHPGGNLGKRLMGKVKDEMLTDNFPLVREEDDFISIVHKISSGMIGLAIVKFNNGNLGIITDGDIRRAMDEFGNNVFSIKAEQIASKKPALTSQNTSICAAIDEMDYLKVSALIIVENDELLGVFKK